MKGLMDTKAPYEFGLLSQDIYEKSQSIHPTIPSFLIHHARAFWEASRSDSQLFILINILSGDLYPNQ